MIRRAPFNSVQSHVHALMKIDGVHAAGELMVRDLKKKNKQIKPFSCLESLFILYSECGKYEIIWRNGMTHAAFYGSHKEHNPNRTMHGHVWYFSFFLFPKFAAFFAPTSKFKRSTTDWRVRTRQTHSFKPNDKQKKKIIEEINSGDLLRAPSSSLSHLQLC